MKNIKDFFPQLDNPKDQNRLVYFDNAASTLRPKAVAQRIADFYMYEAANIHRGAHRLGRKGTENYENVRNHVKKFINASSSDEVIFTSGTTQSINFICVGLESKIDHGDEIFLSVAEHHSNIVPWQQLAQRRRAKIVWIPIKDGVLDLNFLENAISSKTKVISTLFYSNVLGSRFPVEGVIELARKNKILVSIDAAQAVLHEKIDVQKLDVDFISFSAHKMFGPNGVGVLYGKKALLDSMNPAQFGGSMIDRVTTQGTTFNKTPYKFEAGTPNISGVIGFGEALKFIESCGGVSFFKEEDSKLAFYLYTKISEIKNINLFSGFNKDIPLVSFNLEGVHPSDLAELLDNYGIAVRAGHLCAQPLMDFLKVKGVLRVSLAAYNSKEEIDYFISSIKNAKDILND